MTLTVRCPVHFDRRGPGARKVAVASPTPGPAAEPGRVPRVARLMALAIHIEHLVATGAVASLAEVARVGHVTRARVTQIMNLLLLAPDLQEELLFLPRTVAGRDVVILRDLQPITLTPDWSKQRQMWRQLVQKEKST